MLFYSSIDSLSTDRTKEPSSADRYARRPSAPFSLWLFYFVPKAPETRVGQLGLELKEIPNKNSLP